MPLPDNATHNVKYRVPVAPVEFFDSCKCSSECPSTLVPTQLDCFGWQPCVVILFPQNTSFTPSHEEEHLSIIQFCVKQKLVGNLLSFHLRKSKGPNSLLCITTDSLSLMGTFCQQWISLGGCSNFPLSRFPPVTLITWVIVREKNTSPTQC